MGSRTDSVENTKQEGLVCTTRLRRRKKADLDYCEAQSDSNSEDDDTSDVEESKKRKKKKRKPSRIGSGPTWSKSMVNRMVRGLKLHGMNWEQVHLSSKPCMQSMEQVRTASLLFLGLCCFVAEKKAMDDSVKQKRKLAILIKCLRLVFALING